MLLCRLVQTWMSLDADTDRPPPRWCERHLASCPACQRAGHATAQLTRRLTQAVGGLRQPAPPFLASRIIAAARTTAPSSASAAWRVAWTRVAWALGAASLAILAAVTWWPRVSSGLDPATSVVHVAQNPPDLAATLPFKLPASAHLLAYGARLDEPLEREWQHMVADARTAARSLAAAFVPETAIEY